MKKRVDNNEISIGQPLEWNVENTAGRWILPKGFIYHTEESLRRPETLGHYYDTQNH